MKVSHHPYGQVYKFLDLALWTLDKGVGGLALHSGKSSMLPLLYTKLVTFETARVILGEKYFVSKGGGSCGGGGGSNCGRRCPG